MFINSVMPMKDKNGKNIDPMHDLKSSLKILDHSTLRIGSSFIYNVCFDAVEPMIGSLIYCKLAMNQFDHSGIYVGDGQIVHLDGSGLIEMVSASTFLARLDGRNIATSIYVSCKNNQPIGLKEIAERAKSKVGEKVEYDVLLNNCHKFSATCITGNDNVKLTLFSSLIDLAKKHIDFDEWRVWDRKSFSFRQTTAAIEAEKNRLANQEVEKYIKEMNKSSEDLAKFIEELFEEEMRG